MRMILAFALLAGAVTGVTGAAEIRSGLNVGTYPKAYNVTDVTGPAAGNGSLCYRCRYGTQPVVNIFVHKMDENVANLIEQIDQLVGKNRDKRMAAFVVLLTDDPSAAAGSLQQVAKSKDLKHTPLTVYPDADGPASYRLSRDADVTVMMWVDQEVKVNHALRAGDLNAVKIAELMKDTAKILN